MFKKLIALLIVAAVGYGVYLYGPERAYHDVVNWVTKGADKAEKTVTKDNLQDAFSKGSDKVRKGGDLPYKDAALEALKNLNVTDKNSTDQKYNRTGDFGTWINATDAPGWAETLDGRIPESTFKRCDVRQAAVVRDAKNAKVNSKCVVTSGSWTDPYGWKGQFVTVTDSSKFDLDHVVPLKDAWLKGASNWDKKKRVQLANDEMNVVFPSASANRSKGSKSIDKYTPARNSAAFCDYVTRYTAVKGKYGISVTTSEKKAIDTYMAECGLK